MTCKVPVGQIEWIVGRMHVGTSPYEVEMDIRARCADRPEWTPAMIREAVRIALRAHDDNRRMYAFVTGTI